MIFVTATIVDPAGNRVHSDDELPFNPATIPAQPSGASGVKQTTIQPPANSPIGAVVVTPVTRQLIEQDKRPINFGSLLLEFSL